jgi:hypothetical protein
LFIRKFIVISSLYDLLRLENSASKKGVVHSSLAMKLLLEGLFAALMLIVVLVSMVALANYHEQRTIERSPPATQNVAVVASEDGESYQLVEWDASCDEVWGVQSESDIEVNFSEFEAEACNLQSRPFLATSRHPGVRPTDGHRAEPSSENPPSRHFGE